MLTWTCHTLYTDSLSYIYLMVAIMALGYTAFPLSPRNSASVTAHLIRTVGVEQVYVSADAAMQSLMKDSVGVLSSEENGRVVEVLPMIKFDELNDSKDGEEDPLADGVKEIADGEVTVILHSSGTLIMDARCEARG